MTQAHPHPCIVVGVTEHQPPQVIRQDAGFARRFGATLVCAHVDADAYVVAEHPDGSVGHARSTLTCPKWDTAVFDRGLADRIKKLAGEEQVLVELRELAGDIGHALGRLPTSSAQR